MVSCIFCNSCDLFNSTQGCRNIGVANGHCNSEIELQAQLPNTFFSHSDCCHDYTKVLLLLITKIGGTSDN